MSKENSYKAYTRSSFDAIETTRRLSDDLADRENSTAPKQYTNHYNNSDEGTHATGTLSFPHTKHVNSTSNNAVISSSSVDFLVTKTNPDVTDHNEQTIVIENENNHDQENNGDENRVDQRSESDSDLESPDDFDGNTYNNQNYCKGADLHRDDDEADRRHHKGIKNNAHFQQSNGQQHAATRKPNVDTNESYKTTTIDSDIDASDFESSKFHTSVKVNEDKDILEIVSTSSAEIAGTSECNHELNFPENMYEDKVHHDDVINQSEKLDAVKEIRVQNLKTLQNLDKNDPAVRRLFMRPRVSAGEVKSLKVDPDIKSMVNEFLRTNVTENFIIARVLRENYATFYSWLASHIQTERNAWAARMGQAMENAERERKGSLECRNLIVEAATRLSTLARTMGNSMPDSPLSKEDGRIIPRKGPSLRHGTVRGIHQSSCMASLSNQSTDGLHDNQISPQQHQHTVVDMIKKIDNSTSSVLRQSSFNIIEVPELVCYESDPGTGRASKDDWRKHHNASQILRSKKQTVEMNGLKNLRKNKSNVLTSNKLDTGTRSCSSGKDAESLHYGYTVNGVVVDYEDETDWKEVLTDSIDVLMEACDALLTDKKACFQLLSGSSSHCGRLVDILASYIQDNQAKDYLKRKEIEKRLEILERENRAMQEEMGVLRKTLLDKSEDAMVLRTHLNHIESVVKYKKVEKVDKCVGTNAYSSKRNPKNVETVKGSKTAKSKSPYMSVEGIGKDEKNKNKGDKKPNLSEVHKLSKSPNTSTEPTTAQETKQSLIMTNKQNGYSSDKSDPGVRNQFKHDTVALPRTVLEQNDRGSQNTTQFTNVVRQPSFIEISEEKLEKLKNRAKKLESSLHQAISSMDTLNKSAHWMKRVRVRASEKSGPALHIQKVNEAGNHHQTAKNIAYWRKPGLTVNNTLPSNGILQTVCSKSNLSFEIPRATKDNTPGDLSLSLFSEPSSLLQGKSILTPRVDAEPGMSSREKKHADTISSLKLVPDRSQGLTPRSLTSRADGYHSDDEERRSKCRQQQDLSARSEISHKVRARRGQVKQLVSKCLRCQKLFSPTDNHKLACCYHTKRTERLEQYDHMGMLVKVIHAWTCCNQPQEADGCCFGKHV